MLVPWDDSDSFDQGLAVGLDWKVPELSAFSEITASVPLAACTSIPMYRSIGASSRGVLLNSQLEEVRRGREAPTFVLSGNYVAARRRHPL